VGGLKPYHVTKEGLANVPEYQAVQNLRSRQCQDRYAPNVKYKLARIFDLNKYHNEEYDRYKAERLLRYLPSSVKEELAEFPYGNAH
jgi:hypothetical protein